MKKNICNFIVFLLVASQLFAQSKKDKTSNQSDPTIKLSFGEEFRLRTSKINQLLKTADGDIMLIRSDQNFFGSKVRPATTKFNKKLNIVKEEEMSMEGLPNGIEVKDLTGKSFFELNNKIHGLTSYDNRKQDKEYLFVSELKDNGKLSKPTKIAVVESKTFLGHQFSKVGVTFSQDSTKILTIESDYQKRRENIEVGFNVYDVNFQVLWKGEITFPYNKKTATLSDYSVDNQGNVYVILTRENEERKSRKEADNIQELFIYKKDAEKAIRCDVKVKDKVIHNLRFLQDKDQNMIVVGLYGSAWDKSNWLGIGASGSSLQGFVYFKLNTETGKLEDKKVNQLSQKTFDFFRVKPKKIAAGGGLERMVINRVWVTKQGDIVIDLERYYIIEQQRGNGVFQRTVYHYYSESALITKLNANGTLVYETIVPKAIKAVDTAEGLGHITVEKGDELIVIYNDHPKNFAKTFKDYRKVRLAESPDSGTLISFKTKKVDAVSCTISPNGKLRLGKLFNYKDVRKFIDCSNYLQIENKIFVLANSGSKNQLLQIAY